MKTQQSKASVKVFIDAIEDVQRREDCRKVSELMQRLTKEPPQMWGASMVGFGSYHYRYDQLINESVSYMRKQYPAK